MFFSLVFPAILITVALANNSEPSRIRLAVADNSGSDVAAQFSLALSSDPLFSVSSGEEAQMRSALLQGEHSVLLILPANFEDAESGAELTLVVDAAQVRQLGLIMPALEQKLIQIEREFRGTEPLFSLAVEDVKARSQLTAWTAGIHTDAAGNCRQRFQHCRISPQGHSQASV